MQYCSLQHQTLLSTPDTSTAGHFLHFGSAPIYSGAISPLFPSSILDTYWPGDSSFSVISFCLFILFMGFSRQECWSGLSFPSPVDHILSLSIITHTSWVSLHCMAHSFTELYKAVIHVIILVSFLWFWFSFCWPWDWRFLLLSALWWLRIRGLCKVPDGSYGKDWVLLWWAGPCSVNL